MALSSFTGLRRLQRFLPSSKKLLHAPPRADELSRSLPSCIGLHRALRRSNDLRSLRRALTSSKLPASSLELQRLHWTPLGAFNFQKFLSVELRQALPTTKNTAQLCPDPMSSAKLRWLHRALPSSTEF